MPHSSLAGGCFHFKAVLITVMYIAFSTPTNNLPKLNHMKSISEISIHSFFLESFTSLTSKLTCSSSVLYWVFSNCWLGSSLQLYLPALKSRSRNPLKVSSHFMLSLAYEVFLSSWLQMLGPCLHTLSGSEGWALTSPALWLRRPAFWSCCSGVWQTWGN